MSGPRQAEPEATAVWASCYTLMWRASCLLFAAHLCGKWTGCISLLRAQRCWEKLWSPLCGQSWQRRNRSPVRHLRGGSLVPNLPQIVSDGGFVAADDENDASSQSGRCWSSHTGFRFRCLFQRAFCRTHGDPVTTAGAGGQDSLYLSQSEQG
mmetsp:Transcript_47887/g.126774  ORF Transcript_47887/g.126774 Transcript_47887/m.126774 type:complete len:153 (+) Transcript_47887:566-1024(+)